MIIRRKFFLEMFVFVRREEPAVSVGKRQIPANYPVGKGWRCITSVGEKRGSKFRVFPRVQKV
jgi:hypothetical protein